MINGWKMAQFAYTLRACKQRARSHGDIQNLRLIMKR